ncbi:DNA-binding IclR family transcriptional regulator [Spinactinospora alkalitolerans]|uniref:DNA-binding IclR family transcriptional regulator n=1 Tax=Spinactinospora alkalitolerans TaxID=687207 RepID=A0A852TX86_9ACTN|nr:IclR family transcriptional regulator C-terminal domain-containing protein [Spinactinospora alkalitolerans]NYE47985.1 DNA-binding IclR family transcriptional regulator [Spinactinospora alkalitolerans]
MATSDQQAHGGAIEVLAIMNALVSRAPQGWGVRELADHLGSSRSTVNRALASLAEHRLAGQASGGLYTVGPRLRVLSAALRHRHPLFAAAGPLLDGLRDATQATAVLSVSTPDPSRCTVLLCREPMVPVRYTLRPGTQLPSYAGAAGLAILTRLGTAALPPKLDPPTPSSPRTPDGVAELLTAAERRGGVVSIGKHIPDAAGVAQGFRVNQGMAGSISVSRPRVEFDDAQVDDTLALISQTIGELTAALAHGRRQARALVPFHSGPEPTLIGRITRLITCLCAVPTAVTTAADLAAAVGARSVATERLVRAAEASGLLSWDDDAALAAGPLLLGWAAALAAGAEAELDLADLAAEELARLAADTGETVGLATFDGSRARLVATVPGREAIRYVLETGVEVPLHAGAIGKSILAYVPELLESIELVPLTERTQVDKAGLRAELARIAARGWAIGEGERISEAYGIAAPFFIDRRIRGAVTVTVPRHRMDPDRSDQTARVVRQAASRLTSLFSTEPVAHVR